MSEFEPSAEAEAAVEHQNWMVAAIEKLRSTEGPVADYAPLVAGLAGTVGATIESVQFMAATGASPEGALAIGSWEAVALAAATYGAQVAWDKWRKGK